MNIDVFYLKMICTCDQCDSPFCALQLTALIKPNWRVLLHCCASLYHSLIVVQPSWTTIPCPTTKLSLLISESFVGTKQSVISLALKTPLKTRLGICIYKTLLLHRVDDHIGFTSSCPPHNLQQNCAHDCVQMGEKLGQLRLLYDHKSVVYISFPQTWQGL